jgi:DNA-binding XRE family transcriptional regulator/molybdate-binding protein
MPAAGVRIARRAAGLSQAELAAAAGVSRQLVGAIEAGRHRPGIDAALALARVLDQPVEDLFASETRPPPAVAVLPRQDPSRAILAAKLGDTVVYAPASSAAPTESWTAANAVLEDGEPRALPGADLEGLVVVGCDPALGLASALLPQAGPRRLIGVAGSTAGALEALAAGRAHAALVHGPRDAFPVPPRDVLRLHLARWQVGLARAGHRRARTLADFAGRRARVIQREPGASSQKAYLHALAREGMDPPPGPIATGHLDVARRVAIGASGGVTIEPAALAHGLEFLALEEHAVEIWIDRRWTAHPGAVALEELLNSRALHTRLGLVGGYELAGCGSRVEEGG